MAVKFFSGFETGDTKEWVVSSSLSPGVSTDVVTAGGYSLKLNWDSTGNRDVFNNGQNIATAYFRFWLYSSAAGTAGNSAILRTDRSSDLAQMSSVILVTDGVGGLKLRLRNETGAAQVGSDFAISPNVWNLIENKVVPGTGNATLELKVNGAVVATASNLTMGPSSVGRYVLGKPSGITGGTGFIWIDDFLVKDDAYPGPGYCIARQGVAGTPTYNAWAKNGAATAALCWSETPFATGKNCSNIGLNNVQTMLVGSFNSAGSAQEGLGTISSYATINATKTGFVAKATVAGNISIRVRAGGADTDTVKAVTTTDGYYEVLNSLTYTNLTDGTLEIGAVDDVAGVTDTVEDMWQQADYTPGTATQTLTATSTSTPTLQKSVGKTLSATSTSTPSLVKQIAKLMSITSFSTPTLTKGIGKTLAATSTSTPTLQKQVSKTLSVTSTSTPTLTKQIAMTLTAVTTSTASLIWSIIPNPVAGAIAHPVLFIKNLGRLMNR
jgi:hypothetical protein